jgi:radical SAM protein with 4Fe4S-binding SPASM domain
MRRPNNLRTSSYISNFKLPGDQFACAVHGYSAAVDILDKSLIEKLEENNLTQRWADANVERLLEHRGYLTTKTDTEETKFFTQIQQLFWDKQPFMADFALDLAAEENLNEPEFIGNLFAAFNELRGSSIAGTLEINLLKLKAGSLEALPALLTAAKAWDFKVHLIIRDTQLEQVSALVEEEQATKVSIYFLEPKASWFTSAASDARRSYPFNYIVEFIAKQMQVEILVNVEALPSDCLSVLLSTLRAIKSKIHSENEAQLIFIPITPDGSERNARIIAEGIGMIPLYPEEIADYRQLENHLWSQRVVRFRPCFSPSDRRFSISSSGEINLATNFGHSMKLIGHVSSTSYDIDHTALEVDGGKKELSELPAECDSCKLSLICGGNCHIWNPSIGEHFTQKMARLLTIPFINQV